MNLLNKLDFSVFTIINSIKHNGPLAQMVEQQTLNLRVAGSIPARLKCESGGTGRHARLRI